MADLKELLAYILLEYPNQNELSNARVTKLIYLCDWKYCIDHGKKMTGIEWYFDNFGPFVWDVFDTAKNNPDVFTIEYSNNYNSKRLGVSNSDYKPNLSEIEKEVVKHVINSTESKSWDSFIQLVYSTYPVISSEKYNFLDLLKLASEYKHSEIYKEN